MLARCTEVGIYKRKQESKKTRKHAFGQESDQEKRKKRKKTCSRPRKRSTKNKSRACFLSFFLTFMFSFINSHLSGSLTHWLTNVTHVVVGRMIRIYISHFFFNAGWKSRCLPGNMPSHQSLVEASSRPNIWDEVMALNKNHVTTLTGCSQVLENQ